MRKYTFRNKVGHFTKARLNGRVFNEQGQELFGTVKRNVTRSIQKATRAAKTKTGKTRKSARVRKARPRKRKQPLRIRDGSISRAVPRGLSPGFRWFCENLDNVPNSSRRKLYVILRVSKLNFYTSKLGITPETLIPVRLPNWTAGRAKNATAEQLLNAIDRKKFEPIDEVVAVIAKRKMKDIRDNAKNNPLIAHRLPPTDKRTKDFRKKKRRRL